jgi:peptidoglycan/LPS O-acetylase OafA/YrhL
LWPHSLAQSPPVDSSRPVIASIRRSGRACHCSLRRVRVQRKPVDAPSVRALSLLPWGPVTYPLGGVEWSLVYELFFYALLAAIALVPRKNAREWAMLAWLVAIVAAALVAPGRATKFLPTASTILFSAFNLPFILGVLAYSWFSRVTRLPVLPLAILVPLGLVAAIRTRPSELQLAFLAVSFASLVLVAADMSRRWEVSASNPLVKLGDWSYGLYLVHVPVITGCSPSCPSRRPRRTTRGGAGVALVAGRGYGAIEITAHGTTRFPARVLARLQSAREARTPRSPSR